MRKAFREILRANRGAAGKQLLEKAFVANRLAKISRGKQRARLYGLKQRYVLSAMRLLPETFAVDGVLKTDERVVVGVQTTVGFAFHLPGDEMPATLHALMEAARRSSVEARVA